PGPRALAVAPRAALPPEDRLAADGGGTTGVGRRPDVQPRVPRSPLRDARARRRGHAAADGRAHLLAAAGSLEAAVGAVARRGDGGRRLRADLQVAPRAR